MATSFQGWGSSWGNSWGSVTVDPNAMVGSASFSFTAALQVNAGEMQGSAAFSLSATLVANQSAQIELLGGGIREPKKLGKDSYWHRLLSPPIQHKLEEIAPEIAEVIEAEAVAVVQQPKNIDAQAEVQRTLESLGFAYREAYKEIYLELVAEMHQQQEDEQIAAIVAALL